MNWTALKSAANASDKKRGAIHSKYPNCSSSERCKSLVQSPNSINWVPTYRDSTQAFLSHLLQMLPLSGACWRSWKFPKNSFLQRMTHYDFPNWQFMPISLTKMLQRVAKMYCTMQPYTNLICIVCCQVSSQSWQPFPGFSTQKWSIVPFFWGLLVKATQSGSSPGRQRGESNSQSLAPQPDINYISLLRTKYYLINSAV